MRKAAHHILRRAKDHFVPHEGNGHVPHALHHRNLLGYGVFAIVLKILTIVVPIALPASSLFSSSITPTNIVSLTNVTRKSLGLAELRPNELLAAAAVKKAQDMLDNGYFAHTSPTGLTVWTLLKQVGYRYTFAGENLAVHFESAEDVNAGWLSSPTHKANIVNPRFTEIGIGIVHGTFEKYPSTMVVQVFGEPVPAKIAVKEPAPDPAPPAPAPAPAARIIPKPAAYEIRVDDTKVVAASVQLGEKTVPLTETEDGALAATLVYDPNAIAPKGETMNLIASTSDSLPVVTPLAVVVPATPPKDLYAFAAGERPTSVKVLGMTIDNLDDDVRRFYLYAVLFLIGLTLVSVLVRFHMKRLPTIAHAIVIAALGVSLMVL